MKLRRDSAQRFFKRLLLDGFEQVILRAVLDRQLCIGKLLITGQKYDLRQTIPAAQLRAEIKAVHDRHIDIQKDDIRLELKDQFQRIFSVRSLADDLKPKRGPRDRLPQKLAEVIFIVDQYDLQHELSPPGRYSVTRVNTPGSLLICMRAVSA